MNKGKVENGRIEELFIHDIYAHMPAYLFSLYKQSWTIYVFISFLSRDGVKEGAGIFPKKKIQCVQHRRHTSTL